jgi:hypothetical protein
MKLNVYAKEKTNDTVAEISSVRSVIISLLQ